MSQRIGRPRGRWLRRGQRAGNSLPQTSSLAGEHYPRDPTSLQVEIVSTSTSVPRTSILSPQKRKRERSRVKVHSIGQQMLTVSEGRP